MFICETGTCEKNIWRKNMNVIEFSNELYVKLALKNCNWDAGTFLYSLIEENKRGILGWNYIFVLVENEKVISYCTLSQKDCVEDDNMVPWIGFVFTMEEYRGNRYSKVVINRALEKARFLGYNRVYLATDHIGLYEKYGFHYLETRKDIYEEDSRVYYIDINKE